MLESLFKHPEIFISYDDQCNASTVKSLEGSIVCTVGEISSWPRASNVIPGKAIIDTGRAAIIYELSNGMHQICDQHSVSIIVERKLKSTAYTAVWRMAGEDIGDVPVLMSGAGQMQWPCHLTKVGMVFVHCRGGISHCPEEHVIDDDVWAAGLAILSSLETRFLPSYLMTLYCK